MSQPTDSTLSATLQPGAESLLRALCLTLAALAAVGAVGFTLQARWATSVWPWPEVGMSHVWIGSIAFAIAAPLLCIAITREFAALAGLGLNFFFFVVGAGTAAYMGWRLARWGDPVAGPMVESALFGLLGAAAWWWAQRLPVRDPRPMPGFVRAAFVGFVAVLLVTGSAVALQTERVFPWNLQPPTSTIFGLVFFGAAALFVHAVVRARWAFAAAPLWSFLAYDPALFVPYFGMLGAEPSSALAADYGGAADAVNRTSLAVFLLVLSVSCAIALYALFVHPPMRVLWPRQVEGPAAPPGPAN